MTHSHARLAFLLLLAALAAFLWSTSAALPPVVASHFAGSGVANGFMARGPYVTLMFVIGVGVPLLIGFLPSTLVERGSHNLNIPNRDHWLAPQRRDATLAFLRVHGLWFGAAVAIFLGYVHWLVVQANRLQPPELSTRGILGGLAVFGLVLVAWLVVLFRRFGKPG